MRASALQEALQRDKAAGLVPFFVSSAAAAKAPGCRVGLGARPLPSPGRPLLGGRGRARVLRPGTESESRAGTPARGPAGEGLISCSCKETPRDHSRWFHGRGPCLPAKEHRAPGHRRCPRGGGGRRGNQSLGPSPRRGRAAGGVLCGHGAGPGVFPDRTSASPGEPRGGRCPGPARVPFRQNLQGWGRASEPALPLRVLVCAQDETRCWGGGTVLRSRACPHVRAAPRGRCEWPPACYLRPVTKGP